MPPISGEDEPALKKWVISRLEDISDADSDVLADYVLALVVDTNGTDEANKQSAKENLVDFLHDQTSSFVDDVFGVIQTKAYLPGHVASHSQPVASQTTTAVAPAPVQASNPPAGPSALNPAAQGFVPGSGDNNSRKRAFNDRETSEPRDVKDPHYGRASAGERSMKQMRRGVGRGGGMVADRNWRQGGQARDKNFAGFPGLGSPGLPQQPNMPAQQPSFPPFDFGNPMNMMLGMQQAMGMPPMPPFSQLSSGSPTGFRPGQQPPGFPRPGQQRSPSGDMPPRKFGQRCRDYDTKGFCSRGANCPYDHGPEAEAYDPQNASLKMDIDKPLTDHPPSGHHRGRGGRGSRGGGGHGQTRGGRAPFSSTGPNFDKSNTKVVVEHIPEDKFTEEAVREYFSEFGNIQEVDMQPYKRLAILKFEDYASAKRAYNSPKAIFDNRFVKVYWYKPEDAPPANGTSKKAAEPDSSDAKMEDTAVDPEEFKKKQEEAQKAFEEKQRKIKEAAAARAELERKLKEQEEERKKLMEKLAARNARKGSSTASSPTEGAGSPNKSILEANGNTTDVKTDNLRAKLAELQAEANGMGLSHEEQQESSGEPAPWVRGRGRATYRGRGGYVPRGRGFDSSRGSYRGRGGFGRGGGRGGVMRLDNRPKKVAVPGVPTGSDKDEALRSYLFSNYEFDTVEPHPERPDTQVVTFKERYVAEMFINAAPTIAGVGKVELSWVQGAPAAAAPATKASHPSAPSAPIAPGGRDDTAMGGAGSSSAPGSGPEPPKEVEYDVAEDDDRFFG
ncbi:hypothetical protein BDY21DRAFT_348342 [Lineolata rhizophorae]|uniref:CCCH zinc finger and RRM domain-containing protein n=1 Tax=Lineolata rhizophorae TaxID=578093 RepID=A0A6A6NWU9_9PEZI|nr:hypothetical protein BDY21DRAFT_348342 [Lineolata rhizophorae]